MLLRAGWYGVFALLVMFGLGACGGGGGGATVAPKIWHAPQLIETGEAGDAQYPQLGFDAEGDAIAVWSQSDGARRNIYSNRYTKAGVWETAELIEHYNVGNAYGPQIAVGSQGSATVVWRHNDGITSHIFSNRYTQGSGWGTMQALEDSDASASSSQIAVDKKGNAMAVWSQQAGGTYSIFSNRYDMVSAGWQGAELIETDDAGNAVLPQIAFDIDNNAIAVWYQSDGLIYSIFSNRYINGFMWEHEKPIETDAGQAGGPQIAFDKLGNAIAVWPQVDASGDSNIWANRYVSGLDWGVAEQIQTDHTQVGFLPEIAFDSEGNAIAVWEQHDGITTTDNIWANRYVNGSGWGAAELLETDNSGDASYPRVVFDSNDNGIVVWYQDDGTTANSIYSRRYVKGSGWEEVELIEDSAADAQKVEIAVDGDGNAMAIWQQHDGTNDSIYAASYR